MENRLQMDYTTKIFFVVFVVAVSYFVLSMVMQVFFLSQPRTMGDYMARMMGSSPNSLATNFVPLIMALGIGLLVSLNIKPRAYAYAVRDHRQRALRIVMKKLSVDEKKMLKEIETAGEITQDSLRARLGWSKAKVSTTLTRLDKMNMIQRERQGKTYKVFLSKDLR